MKLVNPPVALMFHEGAPRLAEAGVHVPGLLTGDQDRIALEAYPGLLARSIIGRESYKSDTRSKQSAQRKAARERIVKALPIATSRRLKQELVDDGSGDSLDAVLCAVQAAGGWRRRKSRYGLPARIHRCEGWIVSA